MKTLSVSPLSAPVEHPGARRPGLEGEWARLRGLVLERQVKTWQPSARNFATLASGSATSASHSTFLHEHLQSGVGIRQYLLRPFDKLQCVRCVPPMVGLLDLWPYGVFPSKTFLSSTSFSLPATWRPSKMRRRGTRRVFVEDDLGLQRCPGSGSWERLSSGAADVLHTTGDLRGFRIGHHAPGGRGPRMDCNRPSGSSTALHLLRIMDRRGQHENPRGCKRKNALEPTCLNSQLLISALLTLNFFLSEIQGTLHVCTISCSMRIQRC